MAHEPDEADPGAGGGEAGHAQSLRRNRDGARRSPLHPFGEQRVKRALDDEDQGERGPQIPHRAAGLAPGAGAGFAAGGAGFAATPSRLPKYRKKPLSGVSTNEVLGPVKAFL